mmetsp:Transcript_19942/g.40595  ORF Transcript_19942/g.40595 Transcript_19942/m.40595 type:complete len:289 (+) Transcript_19942:363-1229(+)
MLVITIINLVTLALQQQVAAWSCPNAQQPPSHCVYAGASKIHSVRSLPQRSYMHPQQATTCTRTRSTIISHASSWGDEGQYLEKDDDDARTDDFATPSGGGIGERGNVIIQRIRDTISRLIGVPARTYSTPLKTVAIVCAIALSIFSQGRVQQTSASGLAVILASILTKRIIPDRNSGSNRKQKQRTGTNEKPMANEASKERKKRLEDDQQDDDAKRLERGRKWARTSLQTTDELRRKAEEARQAEARAREWADATLRQNEERQRAVDGTSRRQRAYNSDDSDGDARG